ncbi:hypothetical protein [Nocardiopsis oceani]
MAGAPDGDASDAGRRSVGLGGPDTLELADVPTPAPAAGHAGP